MALFNKKEKDGSPQPPGPMRVAEPHTLEPPEEFAPEIGAHGTSTVGATVKVKGELLGEEDLNVEGRVEGIIDVRRNLMVGEAGSVEAEVHASSVTVCGKLVGNVLADERVEIMPTGSLEGNIRAPKVVIAEGAHFKGNVDMSPVSEEGESGAGNRPSKAPGKERPDSHA